MTEDAGYEIENQKSRIENLPGPVGGVGEEARSTR
jgi:hypothetical protein